MINRIINKFSFLLFNKNIFIERVLSKIKLIFYHIVIIQILKELRLLVGLEISNIFIIQIFFGKLIVERNKALHDDLVKNSNKVIVSCDFSKNDFLKRYINFRNKVNILKFVDQQLLNQKKFKNFLKLKKKI